jgi:hypothetical protein
MCDCGCDFTSSCFHVPNGAHSGRQFVPFGAAAEFSPCLRPPGEPHDFTRPLNQEFGTSAMADAADDLGSGGVVEVEPLMWLPIIIIIVIGAAVWLVILNGGISKIPFWRSTITAEAHAVNSATTKTKTSAHGAPPPEAADDNIEALAADEAAATLRAHGARDARVAARACARLWDLSSSWEIDRLTAADAGAIEAAVAALRAHKTAPRVQEYACALLVMLCNGADADGLGRKQRAAEAGAIEVAVRALRGVRQPVSIRPEVLCAGPSLAPAPCLPLPLPADRPG